MNKEDEKGGHGNGRPHLADELGQTVELFVERGFHLGNLGRLAGHLAYFGMVANGGDHGLGPAAHHQRRAEQLPTRIGGFVTLGLFIAAWSCSLFGHRLTRESRLVDQQVDGTEHTGIGRNLIAGFEQNDVAHHNIATGHLHHPTLAPHLHGLLFVEGGEHREPAHGIAFEIETYGGGEEYGKNDADGFNKIVLHKGQHQRNGCGKQQHLNNRVAILFEVERPKRHRGWWRQHIVAMKPTALGYLRSCESIGLLTGRKRKCTHNQ